MVSFKLTVPLADFEKRLLLEFVEKFSGHTEIHTIGREAIVSEVFKRWRWANNVRSSFSATCSDDVLFPFHEGDHSRLWDLCLTRLSLEWSFDVAHQCSRVRDLQENNPDHLQKIVTDDACVEIPAQDFEFWRIISNLFLAVRYNVSSFSDPDTFVDMYNRRGLEPVEFEHALFTPEGDMRSVSLSFLCSRDLHNAVELGATLRSSGHQLSATDESTMHDGDSAENVAQRKEHWETDEFDIWSLLRKATMIERGGRRGDKVWAALDECRFVELQERLDAASVFNGMVVQDGPQMIQFDYFFPVHEPSTYVEYIPWSDLARVSLPQTMTWLSSSTRFASWRPDKASKFDHLMYSDEETYRSLVNLNLTWPYHMESECVVFVLLPLKDSVFIRDLNRIGFWSFWNDCAITQDPDKKEWVLLQTIPGLDFRRAAQQGSMFGVAQKHFSHVMDRLRFGTPQKLHEILGLDCSLQYPELVNVLPYQELISITPEPIGEGARGKVYKAVWKCPEMSDISGPEEITVALKAVKNDDPDYLKRFFRELDANLILLRDESIGGVRFFGVMKTPSDSSPNEHIRHLPADTLFLVTKYATKGKVLDYLDNVLTGDAEDWGTLVYLTMYLSSRLLEYQMRNIVHRDITVNNILIDIEERTEPGTEAIVVRIADHGKCIQLKGPTAELPFCGDQYSSTIEGSARDDYSKASDVRSFGYILRWMVRKVCDASTTKRGSSNYSLPRCIVHWINYCTPTPKSQLPDLVYEIETTFVDNSDDFKDLMSQMITVDRDSLIDPESEVRISMAEPSSIDSQ